MPTSTSSSVNESRGPLQDDIYDIDEGNEADTEDNDAVNHTPSAQQQNNNAQECTPPQMESATPSCTNSKLALALQSGVKCWMDIIQRHYFGVAVYLFISFISIQP